MYKWVCSKCGYEIPVDKKMEDIEKLPPDMKCPNCNAGLESFKLIYEED